MEALGARCASHLSMEADVLKQFITICHTIRQSLGSQDDRKIESLKNEQTKIDATSRGLNEERVALRHAIADFLDRPVEATSIKALEDHLQGDIAKTVADLRVTIEGHVEEIQDLSRTNAMLLQHNIDIFHRMLLSLNGQDQCQTYSPKGTMNASKIKNQLSVSVSGTQS